eukprot:116581_1
MADASSSTSLSKQPSPEDEPDWYAVLELENTATDDDIRQRYRTLCLKHHPDKNIGDEAAAKKFSEVQKAWNVLGDSRSRRDYDMGLNTQGELSSIDLDQVGFGGRLVVGVFSKLGLDISTSIPQRVLSLAAPGGEGRRGATLLVYGLPLAVSSPINGPDFYCRQVSDEDAQSPGGIGIDVRSESGSRFKLLGFGAEGEPFAVESASKVPPSGIASASLLCADFPGRLRASG